ncbi:MAG: nucleoside deaminase [Bacteroidales bacterium]|nr:nucleoside deaminase [Bacteroidales bacterium]
MKISDEQFMALAILEAKKGKTPFGCVIVSDNEIATRAHNTVKTDQDPTAHAEINAIRSLFKNKQLNPADLTLYTTCEPCPMCISATIFAGIGRVVFGVSITEISQYYRQITIPSIEITERGFSNIEVKGGVLYQECLALLKNHGL